MLTVLVVDDEPNVVELVRITLEDASVRVIEAFDGETALVRACAVQPELIFLDVNLPDLSGLDVCRALRRDERFSRTVIVLLTAASRADDVTRGLAAGATHYLTKPFSPIRLLTLVECLIPNQPIWLPR